MAEKLQYIPLKTHSDHSLLQSTLTIDDLRQYAIDEELPALGLCDNANMFGALEFSTTLIEAGIQPIIASNLPIKYLDFIHKAHELPLGFLPHLTIIALNQDGYKNLINLSSLAYDNLHKKNTLSIEIKDIVTNNQGLAVLSGGGHGLVNYLLCNHKIDMGKEIILEMQKCLGDRFYIEIQRHDLNCERFTEPALLQIADEYNIPIIATQEPYFQKSSDIEAHQVVIAIGKGVQVDNLRQYEFSQKHRLQKIDNIIADYQDIKPALINSVELAKRVCFYPKMTKPCLPRFINEKKQKSEKQDGEKQEITETQLLKEKTFWGINEKIKKYGMGKKIKFEDYQKRIVFELAVIDDMNYNGYFLIVADFINWAHENDVPVGPGRGSGAGSLVAYALNITTVDPLKFGLIFERFLNPGRLSMPDFDIDLCQIKREKVIDYVRQKYGNHKVANIITFGKLQAKAVLRDVGRALGMPYGYIDDLCKKIPFNAVNPPKLADAIRDLPYLADKNENDPQAAKLFKIGQKLEGLKRHCSTHAAGIVVAAQDIRNIVPIYKDQKSDTNITQFSMKWVEQAGLVKFDLLGLKTLSIIKDSEKKLRDIGENINIDTIPLDDEKTFKMLSKGNAAGVFQMESSGMQEELKKLKPNCFEELIALISLYRPGPMNNLPSYIARKNKIQKVRYIHPLIKNTTKSTYGIIIYQEQVIEAARNLAGFSLSQADILRRAMGKKNLADMKIQKNLFIKGAKKNNITAKQAETVFDLIEKFAGYGFNRSHATAYAMLSYQTAYLKTHYPVCFIATLMNFDMNNTDKIYLFVQDAKRLQISVLPPCINNSCQYFTPENNSIRYSLATIKNVGLQTARGIEEERKINGDFKDISDFFARIGKYRAINKKSLENLIKAGAFDCLHKNRAEMLESIDILLAYTDAFWKRKQNGQKELFAGQKELEKQEKIRLVEIKTQNHIIQKLQHEKQSLGFYLNDHPVSIMRKGKLTEFAKIKDENANSKNKQNQKFVALINSIREKKTAKGNRYVFVEISDESGFLEAVVFSDTLKKYGSLLKTGSINIFYLSEENRKNGENSFKITKIDKIKSFLKDEEKIRQLRSLKLKIDRKNDSIGELAQILNRIELEDIPQNASLYSTATSITVSLPVLSQNCDILIELKKRYIMNVFSLDRIRQICAEVESVYY